MRGILRNLTARKLRASPRNRNHGVIIGFARVRGNIAARHFHRAAGNRKRCTRRVRHVARNIAARNIEFSVLHGHAAANRSRILQNSGARQGYRCIFIRNVQSSAARRSGISGNRNVRSAQDNARFSADGNAAAVHRSVVRNATVKQRYRRLRKRVGSCDPDTAAVQHDARFVTVARNCAAVHGEGSIVIYRNAAADSVSADNRVVRYFTFIINVKRCAPRKKHTRTVCVVRTRYFIAADFTASQINGTVLHHQSTAVRTRVVSARDLAAVATVDFKGSGNADCIPLLNPLRKVSVDFISAQIEPDMRPLGHVDSAVAERNPVRAESRLGIGSLPIGVKHYLDERIRSHGFYRAANGCRPACGKIIKIIDVLVVLPRSAQTVRRRGRADIGRARRGRAGRHDRFYCKSEAHRHDRDGERQKCVFYEMKRFSHSTYSFSEILLSFKDILSLFKYTIPTCPLSSNEAIFFKFYWKIVDFVD